VRLKQIQTASDSLSHILLAYLKEEKIGGRHANL
jgi:hypothetical protein